jgi:transcriptional regulator with XRE-family HTH domain
MSLGRYLREVREARDLSLREFAKKLECSAAFLSDVELGRRYPSEKVLKDMARILGISIQDLKARDIRAPIEEIKRITADDPRYALAFRTVIDRSVTPEQLLDLAKRSHSEGRSKKKK